jgi:2-keto-4-pentenoate hydratase
MSIEEQEIEALADRVLTAGDTHTSIAPITDSQPDFNLAAAYRVSAAITRRRIARGERPVGWKIGFTNDSIWAQQGLNAPIWAPMYATTVAENGSGGATLALGGLLEPRIEPEIGLRIARVPHPEMDEPELIACIDAVTHGFEIVQSLYPGWRLKPADAVAAFGMHGLYRHGPLVPSLAAERERWLQMLRGFTVVLFRDSVEMDRGAGTNVLEGPLSALRHFVRNLEEYPGHTLSPGDLITTGTLTRALPIVPGERWSTTLEGIPLPGMDLALAA